MRVQTIPDNVLDRIVSRFISLEAVAEKLRITSSREEAMRLEKVIADTAMRGPVNTVLAPTQVKWLSACSDLKPYGSDS